VAEDKGAALRDLRAFPWMRRILYIGIGLAMVQQLTGINTAIYYAPTILEDTGLGASAALVATIAIGLISVIGVATEIILLGHFGGCYRDPLWARQSPAAARNLTSPASQRPAAGRRRRGRAAARVRLVRTAGDRQLSRVASVGRSRWPAS
jgi:MFS family permease